MEFDLHHGMKALVALTVAEIATDTDTDGIIIDTLGFNGIEFIAFTGDWTDGAFAMQIEHADVIGFTGSEIVPAADLIGTPGSLGADDVAARVGYIGGTLADGTYAKRRFVRLTIVSTSTGATGSFIGGIAILGIPMHGPAADQ